MSEVNLQTILRRTITEDYFYDRDKVLEFISTNPDIVDVQDWMDLDDIILELFEQLDGSSLGDDLFGFSDINVGQKLLLRRDDE